MSTVSSNTNSKDNANNSEDLCTSSLVEAPIGNAEAESLARIFAALADPVRLRLFSIVAQSGEICSCDLEAPLAKSQSTISHHTRVLAEAGLIVADKRGRWTWWSIRSEQLAVVRRSLGG